MAPPLGSSVSDMKLCLYFIDGAGERIRTVPVETRSDSILRLASGRSSRPMAWPFPASVGLRLAEPVPLLMKRLARYLHKRVGLDSRTFLVDSGVAFGIMAAKVAKPGGVVGSAGAFSKSGRNYG